VGRGGPPMNVVFTAVPGHGHINPMVPLARTLAAKGHRVTFVTGAEMQVRVTELGFACVAAGPTLEQMQASTLADPGVRASLATEPWKVAAAIFANRAREVLADLDGVDLAPDVVVHDAYELAGPLLAARAGVAWVTHGLGPRWPSYLEDRVGTLLADLWNQGGAPPRGGVGYHAYVEICPPAVRSDDSVGTDPTIESRSVPLEEPQHPGVPAPTPVRRRIYATLGTFSNAEPAPFRSLLHALAGVEAEAVLTVGDRIDRQALGPVPQNVTVERYVPQAQILAHCDLVVCHGGSGTMLAALGRGIPVVIVPQGADQFRNAPFWARSGAAVVVPAAELSATAIEDALAAADLRSAALSTRHAIASMPPVEETADKVERLKP
jgi:UDP:flavonoid glycosyltransferase YjiC (YdhE family)